MFVVTGEISVKVIVVVELLAVNEKVLWTKAVPVSTPKIDTFWVNSEPFPVTVTLARCSAVDWYE